MKHIREQYILTRSEVADLQMFSAYPFGPWDIGGGTEEELQECWARWHRGSLLASQLPYEWGHNFGGNAVERYGITVVEEEEQS